MLWRWINPKEKTRPCVILPQMWVEKVLKEVRIMDRFNRNIFLCVLVVLFSAVIIMGLYNVRAFQKNDGENSVRISITNISSDRLHYTVEGENVTIVGTLYDKEKCRGLKNDLCGMSMIYLPLGKYDITIKKPTNPNKNIIP